MNEFDVKGAFQAAGAILVLGVAGFLLHPFFMDFSLFLLKNVRVQAISADTDFRNRILFTISFALIPILFLALRKMAKLSDLKQKVFAIAAILVSGIIFWQFKLNSLNMRYEELSNGSKSVIYFFALEDLHLELYLVTGFIIGAVIAAIGLYRFKKRQG